MGSDQSGDGISYGGIPCNPKPMLVTPETIVAMDAEVNRSDLRSLLSQPAGSYGVLLAHINACHAVLEEVEEQAEDRLGYPACPSCRRWPHDDDCALKACLEWKQ